MEIAQLYDIFKQYPLVTTDTRNCPAGSIFFALKGANFNGNQYAGQALEKGSEYAVVDEKEYATNSRIILVDDVLSTLQKLANYHRRQLKIPVIGITGTNGKTTTKELVASVLARQYKVIYTHGNLNNHIGVPLTLLRMTKEHEVAVIEMGANHKGEIKILSEIAEPNFGLITNVGYAHLEGFGSFKNIIDTKSELYNFIRQKPDGKIFLNHDNEILKEQAKNITAIYYGSQDNLFVSGKILEMNPYLKFQWKFVDSHFIVQTKLIGDYNLSNILAAIAIGRYFGVHSELICDAIEEYTPSNSRSQLKQTANNTLIIDAYNANPTSMQAALNNFFDMKVQNKSLIIGEMKELGENTQNEHQKIVDLISKHNLSNVFLVGKNFKQTNHHHFPVYDDSNTFKEYLLANPLKDQYILIKGSNSVHLENCIDIL